MMSRECRIAAQRFLIEALDGRLVLAGAGLDPSFGVDGSLPIPLPNPLPPPVVTSTEHLFSDGVYMFSAGRIVRVLPDGTRDPTFGTDGVAPDRPLTVPGYSRRLLKQLVLPDGKLLVGYNVDINSVRDKAIVFQRFALNGDLDSSFGTNGELVIQIPGASTMSMGDFEVFADGRMVVVGQAAGQSLISRALMVRLLANGAYDNSVVGGSIRIESFGAAANTRVGFGDTVLDAFGNMFIRGGPSATTLCKYSIDGSTVTSFGVNGIAQYPATAEFENFQMDPNGFLIGIGGSNRIGMSRYDPITGDMDLSAGPTGSRELVAFTSDFPPARNVSAAFDRHGNIVLAYFQKTEHSTSDGVVFELFSRDGVRIGTPPVAGAWDSIFLVNYGVTDRRIWFKTLRNGDLMVDFLGVLRRINSYADVSITRRPLENALSVSGNSLSDSLNVWTENGQLKVATGFEILTYSLDNISRIYISDGEGNDTITIGDCDGLNVLVQGGTGDDLIQVVSDTKATALRIAGGRGGDHFVVSSAMQIATLTMDGKVDYDSDDLQDVLTVVDAGTNEFSFTSNLAWGTQKVEFGEIDRLELLTGEGDDRVTLDPPSPLYRDLDVFVDAGDGNDDVRTTIRYSKHATVNGGDGDDTVTSLNLAPVQMDGGAGEDTLVLGGTSTANGFPAASQLGVWFRMSNGLTRVLLPTATETLSLAGSQLGKTFTIEDASNTSGQTYFVAPDFVRAGVLPKIETAQLGRLSIKCGSGADAVFVTTPPAFRVTVTGGNGVDQVSLDYHEVTQNLDFAIRDFGVAVADITHTLAVEQVTILSGTGEDSFDAVPSVTTAWTIHAGDPSPGDSLRVAVGGIANVTLTPTGPDAGTVTATGRQSITFTDTSNASLRHPVLATPRFEHWYHWIALNSEVAISTTMSNLEGVVFENLTTGATFTGTQLALWNGTDSTGSYFTIRLKSMPNPVAFPDGNYRVTIAASAIRDQGGNPFVNDQSLNFYVLSGDINRDRRVDFDDLLLLSQNYNKSFTIPNGVAYSRGDLNADGMVRFEDLLVLAQGYGKKLPEMSPLAGRTIKRGSLVSYVVD